MDSGLKALLLGAGTIITCIVISLAFYLTRGARDTATSGFSQISKLNAEFNESDKVMYDGLDVAGSEVLNAINKFKSEELGIIVETKKGNVTNYGYTVNNKGTAENQYYVLGASTKVSTTNAKKITSDQYINQNARFTGEVLRDSNNAIIGIKFTQE